VRELERTQMTDCGFQLPHAGCSIEISCILGNSVLQSSGIFPQSDTGYITSACDTSSVIDEIWMGFFWRNSNVLTSSNNILGIRPSPRGYSKSSIFGCFMNNQIAAVLGIIVSSSCNLGVSLG